MDKFGAFGQEKKVTITALVPEFNDTKDETEHAITPPLVFISVNCITLNTVLYTPGVMHTQG